MNAVGIGRWAGIAVFLAVLAVPAPPDLPPAGQRAAAVAGLMAVWWISEAVPVAATALVPLALYPVLGVLDAERTSRLYADPNIFLFMGGFLLALAMQKCELHRRVALAVISFAGGGCRRMLGGFLVATAAISMWVSNTATAVMMLPIGMAVIARMPGERRFATVLMLGIAYAASIGGIATLVGSPPNMIFAGQARTLFPALAPVDFMRWFAFAFPLALGFLAITWAYLAFVVLRGVTACTPLRAVIREELAGLGPLSRDEVLVMSVLAGTVIAWITRADVHAGALVFTGWATRLGLDGVHDGTVAMAAATLLFLVPAERGSGDTLLNWEWARKLPWDVLLLLGGGFALADGFQASGLADWIAQGFGALRGLPVAGLVLVLCIVTTFMSELMSNTAQVTLMMPVLAAASGTLGVHPYVLMLPATLAASLAFMLPAGTPPNAIVFGSGLVTVRQMASAGLVLNLLGALWITLFVQAFAGTVLGL